MKAVEGKIGRIFVIRLENGDIVPTCLEEFAEMQGVKVGYVTIIGGMAEGNIVTGPRQTNVMPPDPMITPVEEAHEVVGTGIIAPDEEGHPKLHLHAALGRSDKTITGCLRPGVKAWLVGEVIMCEILGVTSKRVYDQKSLFSLLEP